MASLLGQPVGKTIGYRTRLDGAPDACRMSGCDNHFRRPDGMSPGPVVYYISNYHCCVTFCLTH